MDLDSAITKQSRKHILIETEPPISKYIHDLNFYEENPIGIVSLPEFEHLAIERVHVLKVLEQATFKGLMPFSDEWRYSIETELNKLELTKFARLLKGYNTQTDLDFEARRADYISHFILRLAYARSKEQRRWFIAREIEWFKLRFMEQPTESIHNFLRDNNFKYTRISDSLKYELRDCLIAGTSDMTEDTFDQTLFYEVHFSEAAPLLKSQKVYLKNSFAYIPSNKLAACACTKLRSVIHRSYTRCSLLLDRLDDPQISELLAILQDLYIDSHYTTKAGTPLPSLHPTDVEKLYKLHFPLCMRHMHENLKRDHHLKYFSRLQYGLYLKGIGLLYVNAMDFWRGEFTKGMDDTKFQKKYLYEFKHMYGQVGGKINYKPYSCDEIVGKGTGPLLNYGCPFKHFDKPLLEAKLKEDGIVDADVKTIIDLADTSYSLACTKCFERRHGRAPELPIIHPNQYFEESRRLSK